ncbi:MAG TPA: chemotaxis protein CheB [Nitrospirota bacterium]|nr:chemotaxis protein CheB [Nitrospirota bacterium]
MAAKKSARKKAATKRPSIKPKLQKRAIGTWPPPTPERHRPLRPGQADFYVVGIGASAGGLEAFEQFFHNMPSDSGMAFVLIPHLSPEHKSMMVELLKRYTKMEIQEAQEGMEVVPDNVYIIPPNRDLAMVNNRLLLQEPAEQRGIRHPIDYFFRSLAQDRGDQSICIVLSGTGTEGTLGLQSVKGEGGLVLAQDPNDAKYDGMPSSAIATGLVDYVLPVAKMPEVLLRYTKDAGTRAAVSLLGREDRPAAEALQKVYALIRSQRGHDFTLYKQNTVMRRIRKRMAIHEIESLDDYVAYLRNNPHEIDILFNEFLIRVTSFFRDPDAFKSLAEKALPLILGGKRDNSSVRIWVPGCSTGEEAYSLAVICHEYQQKRKGPHRKIQIFATDIDTGAIDIARAGVYPESITVDVSLGRLTRYFVKRGGAYGIKEEIRAMVVFAVQDIIRDPPFSRLDLVSCRNVLIYMGASLQKRVLALFHYALKANGVLFLGSSETVGDASDMFSGLDKKWKIFRALRTDMLPVAATDFRRFRMPAERTWQGAPALAAPGANLSDLTERFLLERYSPPCCVVNDKGDILFIHGKTGKYLEPASGKASLNIIEMAREGIRIEIRTGLRKAATQKKDVVYEGLQVRSNGGYRAVNVEIRYLAKPEPLESLLMVVFNEAAAARWKKTAQVKGGPAEKANERLAAMEYELKSSKEHLQTTIEELETSNEELKSTNEEFQSSNEELQSTNEELETSREELQSTNEELVTVNTELRHKIDELSEVNSDIVNLLTSTRIATLFLTYDLRIRRFTPSTADVINIIQTDVGRPIGDLSLKVAYPELTADAEEVLRTLLPKERNIQRQDGRWFLARTMPYLTLDNRVDGLVVTFVDITDQKLAEQLEANLVSNLHGIMDTMREPFLVLDRNLIVISANRAFYDNFRTAPEETEKRPVYELGNGQWEIPALKRLLDGVLTSNRPFENYRVEHDFPQIGHKNMLLNARRIYREGFKTETILLAIEDVTGK